MLANNRLSYHQRFFLSKSFWFLKIVTFSKFLSTILHYKSFRAKLRIFPKNYFQSVQLCFTHFLLTAQEKCQLLYNLPYVVIYLVNLKTTVQQLALLLSSKWKMSRTQFYWSKINFCKKRLTYCTPNYFSNSIQATSFIRQLSSLTHK